MSNQPPKGKPPGNRVAAPPRPASHAAVLRQGQAPLRPGQAGPAAAKKGPGCLGSLFLELTGIGFLLQIKRKLGGLGFFLALAGVLFFCFILGARIERYGHLGEHQYILQLLPMASCLSPILAWLMSLAFAVGDVLTNATYWLFPQDSNLNMYHLFTKAHPLLTWGAYARMDFFTLPLYALLPGLGSRILYAVASRAFHAGRAKLMKDGGTGDTEALKRQLNQALSDQTSCAQRERAVSDQFNGADAAAERAGDRIRSAEAGEREASSAVQEQNAQTQEQNLLAARAREEAGQAQARASAAGQEASRFEGERDRAGEALRQGSLQEENLKGRLGDLGRKREEADNLVKECQGNLEALARDRKAMQAAMDTGVDQDGRPMTPERMAAAKRALDQNLMAEGRERARLDSARDHQRELAAESDQARRDLENQQKANAEELARFRQDEARAAQARRRQEQAQEELRAKEAAEDEARRAAAESQRRAQEDMARLEALRQEKAAALRDFQSAAARRNALADQLKEARSGLAAANGKVSQIQSALGLSATPPVAPADPSAGHHRHHPDPNQEVIRQYDQAMGAAQAEQRRMRDMMVRQWQAENRGLLPSGLVGGEVAGVGSLTSQGFGPLAAAAVGAAAGSALGGMALHGHMWAEYNPIRQIVHPSHSADVGCYRMDVGYLDGNILSGVGSGTSVAPIAVVGAEMGGVPSAPPPAGPGTGLLPPGPESPGGWAAPSPGGGIPSETSDEQAARDAARKARDEADRYKKQWEESEASADKNDPGYKDLKKQYDDYITSKEDEAAAAQARADASQSQRQADEAAAQAAKDAKDEWIRNRQDDLKAAAEEKAHLEAVMAGAAGAGLSTADQQTRLNQLNQRLSDLHGQLQKEGGDIDYSARDRGVIGPGKEFLEAPEKARQEAAKLDYLQKMQKAAWDHDMVDPESGGKKGDMYGRVGNAINDFLAGKKLDPDMIKQMRDSIGHRIDGTTADTSQLPGPEKPWWQDGDSMRKAVAETGRNISTCQTSDGKVSWSGLAGRVGIGILTGGTSEWVFTPAGALQTTKDAVDRGADGLEATYEGIKETIKQELGGALIGGALKTGAAGFKGMAQAELAGENILKGGAKGAWGGLKEVGKEGVKGLTDVVSAQAWKDTAKGLTGSLGSGLKRTGEILTGEEGLTLGKGAGEGAEAAANAGRKLPPFGSPEAGKLNQLQDAIKSGDPDKVAGLYREGGMKDLSDLQKAGYIKPEDAQKLNQLLQNQVNGAVSDGTKAAVNQFPGQTGVRVKEVLVGDSGSSASGPPTRLKTDADRTLIPTFDEGDLQRYAQKNAMSRDQAYDELSQKFRDSHEANVSKELQDRGFGDTGSGNPQKAADNVGYGSYDRIGGGSGKADSYAEGFTNSRQAAQGKGTSYTTDADGNVSGSHQVSGQSVVDQNQLNRQNYGGEDIGGREPTSIPPSEVPSVMSQQANALEKHGDDPLYVAKAVGRSEKIANTVGESLGDQRLTQAAKEIYSDPGKMNDVLKKYGYVDAHGNPDPSAFCSQGKGSVNGYANSFDSVTPDTP